MKTTSLLKPTGKVMAAGLLGLYCMLASAATAQHPWAAMAKADADFVTTWIERESISAIYPDKDAFAAQLAAARRTFDAEAVHVTNYEGYRQALGHFVGGLQDQHLRVQYSLVAATYQWPGFIVVYRGGHYVTVSTQAGMASEQEVTACDGKPIGEWVRQVAAYEELPFDLESTMAKAAPLVLKDAGSPFVARPHACNIGGRDVTLDWQTVAASKFMAEVAAATALRDRVTAIAPFGADGAWVRMGIFQPQTQAEGKAFKQLLADAPALRDKAVIVIDVRGNGGGPYEWFMGFLRALFGKDYTDYHARARLQNADVYRTTPAILQYFNGRRTVQADDLAPPPDGTPFDDDNVLYRHALDAGKTLFIAPPNSRGIPIPQQTPANPVKARVFVLTDYNCASACISFVDEMKRFPGVEQIGVETSVDSRTGSPFGAPLPSGNGVINVPVMTRDGRERGDNIPQRPNRVFTGNIGDTAAVKAWIRDEILRAKDAMHTR